jgi:hypothetical protein
MVLDDYQKIKDRAYANGADGEDLLRLKNSTP